MGPDDDSLALADFLIAKFPEVFSSDKYPDRYTVAYAIMEWAELEEAKDT